MLIFLLMLTIFNQYLKVKTINCLEILFSVFSLIFSHFFETQSWVKDKNIWISYINFSVQCYEIFQPFRVLWRYKIYSQSNFFIYGSINTCDNAETSCLCSGLVFVSISKLQCRNSNSCFNFLLLFSDNVSLNPGAHNNQLQPHGEWSDLNSRELHFIHLNVISLLPKFDELRNIIC